MSQDLLKEVKKQNCEKVKELLNSKRDLIDINFLDSKTKLGFLHLAIQNYDYDTMLALLEDKHEHNQIDLNLMNGDGLTPLALASSLGYLEGVELLLKQKNIDINFSLNYEDGRTAFHVACANKNNQEVIDQLIKKGADPNIVSKGLGTPLKIAIDEGDNEKAIWLIHNPKVDVMLKDDKDNTCLHNAVEAGLGDFINSLFQIFQDRLQEKPSTAESIKSFMNQQNDQGNTCLHQAVLSNRLSIQKLLKLTGVKLGLDVNIKNKQNKTAEDLQTEKEEKKKQQEAQENKRKNEIKVEKAQVKEEKRRVEKQEREQRKKEEENFEQIQQEMQEKKQQTNRRALFVFFLIFLMVLAGVILFFQAKKNIEKQPYIPKPRTDYDDFL
ncbi:hypothetical protein ABPG72_001253 [Tetrahymena utriculariae]